MTSKMQAFVHVSSPTDEMTELIQRLRSKVHSGHFTPGGGIISADPTQNKFWGGEPIMVNRNPDGPQAADVITRLIDELQEEKARVAAFCDAANALVATLSDEQGTD